VTVTLLADQPPAADALRLSDIEFVGPANSTDLVPCAKVAAKALDVMFNGDFAE